MNFATGFAIFALAAMVSCTMIAQPGSMMGNMSADDMEAQMTDIEDVDDEVGCNGTAVYQVVADFLWNAQPHPTDYPAGSAHWSPLSGTTHSSGYRMWGTDIVASPGVKQVAETGANAILEAEIEACGADNCTPMFSFPCDEFSGTCIAAGTIEVTVDKPRFSAITMIAPSPDWFVGIHDLELCKFGEWIPFYTADLVAHDSGTDDGESYKSPNKAADEIVNIFFIDSADHVTYHPTEMTINPFGDFTITLVEVV
eukprot:TRINITY_DN2373_c0_g2_i10.p1 TRINITY_DN2373_c0_g2~~TRINITY_DN2373_c0_g2_i10.p1  ORF type:complete len:255 (-),score=72.39 TRINITY_DN2373_c0_g2_i10:811-1575(-)